jgi:2'-5' RNA ligase
VRLFVAVPLPTVLQQAIHRAIAPLRTAGLAVKWVDPESVHLTLKFLGEVPADRLGDLAAALDRACAGARPFSMTVGGFGGFPTAARARVLWIGCEPVPPLELLQDAVEREYAALGFPVEGRPFRPHLTLGRARKEARSGVRGAESLLASLAFADAVTVETVTLLESTLTPGGARYAARHVVSLA